MARPKTTPKPPTELDREAARLTTARSFAELQRPAWQQWRKRVARDGSRAERRLLAALDAAAKVRRGRRTKRNPPSQEEPQKREAAVVAAGGPAAKKLIARLERIKRDAAAGRISHQAAIDREERVWVDLRKYPREVQRAVKVHVAPSLASSPEELAEKHRRDRIKRDLEDIELMRKRFDENQKFMEEHAARVAEIAERYK